MNEKQKLEEMIENGFTIAKIGESLEKSESSVRRLLKKHQLKTKRFIDKDDKEFKKCRYCYKKKSIDEFPIARELNGIVYKRCKCNVCYHEMKVSRRRKISDWIYQLKKILSVKDAEITILEF